MAAGRGRVWGPGGGTYTVGEVYNEVFDLNLADLELAVQPAVVSSVA